MEQDSRWYDPDGPWLNPGPVAGPFQVTIGDGSTLTYYWYRFVDQPAIVQADLPPDQRQMLQQRAELIHIYWKKDSEYLTPPTTGSLVSIDPGLIIEPPVGLEVGYVAIVTRQERR